MGKPKPFEKTKKVNKSALQSGAVAASIKPTNKGKKPC